MASTYRIAEKASESLYEDEALRSNLTDHEAQLVLKWATDWIAGRVSAAQDEASAERIVAAETARVRAALKVLNSLGKGKGATSLVRMISALEPVLNSGQPFSREEVLALATDFATFAWTLRST